MHLDCIFIYFLKKCYCTTKGSLVMHFAFSYISFLQRYEDNYSDKPWWRKQKSVCTLDMSGSQDCIFNVHMKSKSCYDGRAPRSLSFFKEKKSTNVNQTFLAMLLKIGEEGRKTPHLAVPHLSVRTLHFHPPLRPKSLPTASLSLGKQTLPG